MRKTVFLMMAVFTTACMILLSSCQNQDLDETSMNNPASLTTLEWHGKVHNEGLDFIKTDKMKTSGVYSKARLDSVFGEYIAVQYDIENTNRILEEINPIKEQLLSGNIPSLAKVRSCDFEESLDNANPLALEALSECLSKITNHLSTIPEEQIFDNPSLLKSLHDIIYKTYLNYAAQSKEPTDLASVELTLGVLYGSVEYWSNSKNVEYWSNIADENEFSYPKAKKTNNSNMTRAEEKKKLTKEEYISVVGGADAIGALAGPHAAVIASAATALYYDVE